MANPSPTIVFRVDLTLLNAEDVGPNTNLLSTGVLHPDRHVGSDLQDEAISSISSRKSDRSIFLPGLLGGSNRTYTHGEEFTEYGAKAVYLRKMYGVGIANVPTHRQLLVIVSES